MAHDEAPTGVYNVTDLHAENIWSMESGTAIAFKEIIEFEDDVYFSGGKDIVTGTANGSAFGASAAQKISFHGATAIVQNSHIDDATDAASAITQLNAVILALEQKGLLASS